MSRITVRRCCARTAVHGARVFVAGSSVFGAKEGITAAVKII
jgi:hypothetical protein